MANGEWKNQYSVLRTTIFDFLFILRPSVFVP